VGIGRQLTLKLAEPEAAQDAAPQA
jgi:hypothetical protein